MELSPLAAQVLADLVIPTPYWHTPSLIAIFGVPGAGKTEVARHLAKHYPLCLLSTDALRLRYALESGMVTRQVMGELAIYLLPRHRSVLLDGIHLARKDRQHVQNLAESCKATATLIYVVADPIVIEKRLQERIENADQVAAEGKFVITQEHFARIVAYLEPPTPDEGVITVETTQGALDEQLDQLHQQLRSNLAGAPPKATQGF